MLKNYHYSSLYSHNEQEEQTKYTTVRDYHLTKSYFYHTGQDKGGKTELDAGDFCFSFFTVPPSFLPSRKKNLINLFHL